MCRYLQSLKFWMVHIVIVTQTVELKLMELNKFLYGNLWQLQTVNNTMPCLFAANDKHLLILYHTMVINANWCLCSQFNLIRADFWVISITWLHYMIFDIIFFGFIGIKLILFPFLATILVWQCLIFSSELG